MTIAARLGTTLLLQQFRPTAVEDELLRADVQQFWSASSQTNNPGSSSVTAVRLETGTTAYHKSSDGIDDRQAAYYGHAPFPCLINEAAAWMVAKTLGAPWTDMVPPSVIRSLWPRTPLVGGFGVLSVGMPGATNVPEPRHRADVCDAAAFFDALIGQHDRHFTNYRWDPASSRLGLLDNAYAFAAPSPNAAGTHYHPHASCFVERRQVDRGDVLHADEVDALQRMLADTVLLANLQAILLPHQFDALKARAERMANNGRLLGVLEF